MADNQVVLALPDAQQRTLFRYAIEGAGYEVAEADSFVSALKAVRWHRSLIIMAGNLVGANQAHNLVSQLRQNPASHQVPVMMVAQTPAQRSQLLEAGADDCIAPNCRPRELVLRVNRLVHRQDDRPSTPDLLRSPPITLERRERTVRINGERCHLSLLEFEVLQLFMANPDRPFTREQIINAAWRGSEKPVPRAVDVLIRRLRLALGPEAAARIETVRALGYRLSSA